MSQGAGAVLSFSLVSFPFSLLSFAAGALLSFSLLSFEAGQPGIVSGSFCGGAACEMSQGAFIFSLLSFSFKEGAILSFSLLSFPLKPGVAVPFSLLAFSLDLLPFSALSLSAEKARAGSGATQGVETRLGDGDVPLPGFRPPRTGTLPLTHMTLGTHIFDVEPSDLVVLHSSKPDIAGGVGTTGVVISSTISAGLGSTISLLFFSLLSFSSTGVMGSPGPSNGAGGMPGQVSISAVASQPGMHDSESGPTARSTSLRQIA